MLVQIATLVAFYLFLGISIICLYAAEAWHLCLSSPSLYQGNFCPAYHDAIADFSELFLGINHSFLITMEFQFGFKMPFGGT